MLTVLKVQTSEKKAYFGFRIVKKKSIELKYIKKGQVEKQIFFSYFL